MKIVSGASRRGAQICIQYTRAQYRRVWETRERTVTISECVWHRARREKKPMRRLLERLNIATAAQRLCRPRWHLLMHDMHSNTPREPARPGPRHFAAAFVQRFLFGARALSLRTLSSLLAPSPVQVASTPKGNLKTAPLPLKA